MIAMIYEDFLAEKRVNIVEKWGLLGWEKVFFAWSVCMWLSWILFSQTVERKKRENTKWGKEEWEGKSGVGSYNRKVV